MKRTAPVRPRRRRNGEGDAISLFPFLAVLVCTMGVLILLLVVISHQARLQAAQEATASTAKDQRQLQENREDAEWRIDNLRESLAAARTRLGDARLELGHLEEQAGQLRAKLADLRRAWEQLEGGEANPGDPQQLEAQHRELQAQIAQAEAELATAEKAAAARRGSYAVVPYEGPNGTRRRPIYLECRANGVAFMPEGIVLGEADFEGPLGPENPLAAGLRAAREHLLRQGAFDQATSGEPYPLILVRPSGVLAYHAARAALESWESDFGYELVGDDWKLEFPPPDPALAVALREAVDAARLRRRLLAEAAPRHYGRYRGAGGSGPAQYTVPSGRGGVVPYAGGPGESDEPARRRADRRRPDDPLTSGSSAQPRWAPDEPSRLDGAGGQPGGTTPAADGEPRFGEYSPPPPTGARDRSTPDGPAEGSISVTAHARPKNLAKTRGENWALPNASPRSTPLTQPIRVECLADRLVLVAQAGRYGGRTVPLGPRTEEGIDTFVSAVWDYMDTWGIAGERMYWRPVLHVYVAPGAEQRYADLVALLEGSGLLVERK